MTVEMKRFHGCNVLSGNVQINAMYLLKYKQESLVALLNMIAMHFLMKMLIIWLLESLQNQNTLLTGCILL